MVSAKEWRRIKEEEDYARGLETIIDSIIATSEPLAGVGTAAMCNLNYVPDYETVVATLDKYVKEWNIVEAYIMVDGEDSAFCVILGDTGNPRDKDSSLKRLFDEANLDDYKVYPVANDTERIFNKGKIKSEEIEEAKEDLMSIFSRLSDLFGDDEDEEEQPKPKPNKGIQAVSGHRDFDPDDFFGFNL